MLGMLRVEKGVVCWGSDAGRMMMWGEGSGLPGNRGVHTVAPPKVICRDVNTIQPAVICYVHQCLCVVAKFSFWLWGPGEIYPNSGKFWEWLLPTKYLSKNLLLTKEHLELLHIVRSQPAQQCCISHRWRRRRVHTLRSSRKHQNRPTPPPIQLLEYQTDVRRCRFDVYHTAQEGTLGQCPN